MKDEPTNGRIEILKADQERFWTWLHNLEKKLNDLLIAVALLRQAAAEPDTRFAVHDEKLETMRKELDQIDAVTRSILRYQNKMVGAIAVIVIVMNIITVIFGPKLRDTLGTNSSNHSTAIVTRKAM